MMSNPEISIIVPVHNLEKYIETTVESLLNQTFSDIEIILVDDGSTDSSPMICDKLAEQHGCITAIHQENLGVSVARNTGVAAAKGKYIGFCDGDDTVEPDMYEFLYNLAVKDNADISLCEVRFILPDGSVKNIATGEYKVWDNN